MHRLFISDVNLWRSKIWRTTLSFAVPPKYNQKQSKRKQTSTLPEAGDHMSGVGTTNIRHFWLYKRDLQTRCFECRTSELNQRLLSVKCLHVPKNTSSTGHLVSY